MSICKKISSCILFICLFSTYAHGQETIRLSISEWPPFLSNTLTDNGLYAHIVEIAFAEMGVGVEYNFQPGKRALLSAEQGKYDGTIAASNSERQAKFYFSDPVADDCNVFFYLKKTNFKWQNENDLMNYIIGAPLGYHCLNKLEEIKKKGIELKIESVVSDIQLFHMLV
jgi:polar amino acid transport system substrate-binding protein